MAEKDLEFLLRTANKRELRGLVETYRFLLLSSGYKVEELEDLEGQVFKRVRDE